MGNYDILTTCLLARSRALKFSHFHTRFSLKEGRSPKNLGTLHGLHQPVMVLYVPYQLAPFSES